MSIKATLSGFAALATISLVACSQSDAPDAPSGATAAALTVAAAPVKPVRPAPAALGAMDHSHIPVALPDGVATPSLSLSVSRDWMSGLNLQIHTEDYHLIPPPTGLGMAELMQPSINADTGAAEGHAHLYINGEKIQRIYGDHAHLPDTLFKPGLNQINVSINNHGHMYWTAQQRQILATLYINLDHDDLVTHRFESYPAMKSADGAMCTTETDIQKG